MYRLLVLLARFIAALALVGCAGVGDETAATTSEIVFARGPHLYVMRSDGSQARLLVRNAGYPAVSPDGRQIAFVRDDNVWVMRRDGSSPRRLTTPPTVSEGQGQAGDYMPTWSPDGRKLYFSRLVDDWSSSPATTTSSLNSIRFDGTNLQRVTQVVSYRGERCITDPTPSPDGRLIAYAEWSDCEHGWNPSVKAVTPAGARTALGFAPSQCAFDLAFAPDGRELAFTATECEGDNLGVYAQSQGGDERRLAAAPSSSPAWSPDGTMIVYVHGWSEGDIWLVSSAGDGPQRITHTRANDQRPTWLPAPAR